MERESQFLTFTTFTSVSSSELLIGQLNLEIGKLCCSVFDKKVVSPQDNLNKGMFVSIEVRRRNRSNTI